MALIQAELIEAVADRADLSPADVKQALSAFEEIMLEELASAVKSRLAHVVQQMVGMKPAAQSRPRRPPEPVGDITVTAKSSSTKSPARQHS